MASVEWDECEEREYELRVLRCGFGRPIKPYQFEPMAKPGEKASEETEPYFCWSDTTDTDSEEEDSDEDDMEASQSPTPKEPGPNVVDKWQVNMAELGC